MIIFITVADKPAHLQRQDNKVLCAVAGSYRVGPICLLTG